ncbi:MAG TPA: hypothetical protein VE931_09685 [Pyrinomonadaceae bacterium]|nr:hypothetical protein [Pyrinomonadaceae bacterium]
MAARVSQVQHELDARIVQQLLQVRIPPGGPTLAKQLQVFVVPVVGPDEFQVWIVDQGFPVELRDVATADDCDVHSATSVRRLIRWTT